MKRSFWNRFFLTVLLILASVLLVLAVHHLGRSRRQEATPEIKAQELSQHLKYLSSDELVGRLSGTPGAEKAAEYIAQEFKSYGLRPVGDGGGYLQAFTFLSGVRLGKTNQLEMIYGNWQSVPAVRQPEPWQNHQAIQLKSDFMPAAFSRSGTFQGAAVFASYGITAPDLSYDDYQGADVKGKFIFVLRYGPEGQDVHSKFGKYHALRYKALTAREKGATGIVYIDDTEDFSKSTLCELRHDNDFADSGIAALSISRRVARDVFRSAGIDLEERQQQINHQKKGFFCSLPNVQLTFHCELVKENRRTANVIGYLEGNDFRLKEEPIILGAHYDHLGMGENGSLASKSGREIHNGADDNASGTAGLLELAHVFSPGARQVRHSLVFIAFSGEEEGLLGSKHYVNHPIFPIEKTVAMINMDMIGRMKDNRLIVGGAGTSPLWKELLARLNRVKNLDLKFQDDGYGPSDHSSFYGKEIPVLFFFTGVHQDYHKPSDDYNKLDVASEEKILRFIYQIAREVDTVDNRPLFTKTRETSRPASGEFRVYLGTIPDYGEEVEGVKLSGVRDGSPAEKAGLRGGDIIVECGGKTIKNIYDYTYTLQEHRVGEVVDMVVLRNQQRVRLKATLEKRSE